MIYPSKVLSIQVNCFDENEKIRRLIVVLWCIQTPDIIFDEMILRDDSYQNNFAEILLIYTRRFFSLCSSQLFVLLKVSKILKILALGVF